ncbi:btuB [Symbiodinium necroappetens]|uniref:BtuB protein n=1 Tax=Symbiodinium necroappetens TaxID=1628268 RepID=A0A812QEM4_9DINO|nr:btuB [Symbiodinium necroappetens]
MTSHAHWRRLLLPAVILAAVLFLSGPVSAASESEAAYQVDLPSGDLQATLLSFARDHQVSIFFSKETVADITHEAVMGTYTLPELFEQLLGDACISYEFVRERLIAIVPGCQQAVAVAPVSVIENVLVEESAPASFVEEILVQEPHVTGTRLRNPSASFAMPLEVIDQTEIRLSGYQAVGELLRYVPAVSGNSASTLISNGGDGTASVTLRGLPASNTLVLLNGRRMNTDALRGGSVDLNTLPLGIVDRIEILKDGASAIYGSDAIAGVVNVITKQDINGLSIDAYTGQSAQGDLQTTHLSGLWGFEGERWSSALGMNYYDQSGVYSRDRTLSASSNDRSRGGIDKRSSAISPAWLGLSSGPVVLLESAPGVVPEDFRAITEDDRFEFRDFTSSIVPSTRLGGFASLQWDMGAQWLGYFEALYHQTESINTLAPTPLLSAFEPEPIIVDAQQVFNPFGEAVFDVRRRLLELGPRKQINDSETYRTVLGFRRETRRLSLDAAFTFNQTDAQETFRNGANAAQVALALDEDCAAPCVPLNIFGPGNSIDEHMSAFIGTDARIEGVSRTFGFTFDLDWVAKQTNQGDVELSTGFEYRRDELDTSPDQILRNNLLLGGGNRRAIKGSREIVEVYAEGLIPLAANRRFVERLDVQVAARVSRYSDFGFQVNPRLVLHWMPTKEITWRASGARGFRAPTLLQLFASSLQSFEQLNDPCTVASNVGSFLGCDLQSDPSLTQYLTITGGDAGLDPERSSTFSTGLVWRPKWRSNQLLFSADWYYIDSEDVVESSAQFVLNQNARLGRFENRVTRNVDGNLEMILATLQNIGRRKVSGYDLSGQVTWNMRDNGRLTLALNATHIVRFQDQFDPTSPSIDKAGTFSDEAAGGLGALPDWKIYTGLSWRHQHWQSHYTIYHVSSLREEIPLLETQRTISSWTTHNFNVSYLGPLSKWFRFTAGVNNLFDEAPPFSAAAFNDSYDGRTYDITGRYFFVKVDKSF